MSFFGLTALGPQSSFQVSLADFSYLNVFTDKDLENAFKAVVDKERLDYININQVETFLRELYRGAPRACDLAKVLEKAKAVRDGRLSLDDVRSLMDQLKEEPRRSDELLGDDGVGSSVDVQYTRQMEEETNKNKWNRGSGSNFGSNQIYRETIRRHERVERAPKELYANTITATQEHGWHDQLSFRQVMHNLKSCPETVYASELIKNGVYL